MPPHLPRAPPPRMPPVPCAARWLQNCGGLRLAGLMTIGMPDYSSRPECFTCLAGCRQAVAAELGLQPEQLQLSMGMSGDFEQAVSICTAAVVR